MSLIFVQNHLHTSFILNATSNVKIIKTIFFDKVSQNFPYKFSLLKNLIFFTSIPYIFCDILENLKIEHIFNTRGLDGTSWMFWSIKNNNKNKTRFCDSNPLFSRTTCYPKIFLTEKYLSWTVWFKHYNYCAVRFYV